MRKIADAVAPRANARHLLKAVGLDRDALRDPLLRIPYGDMMMLSELGSRMTKDVAFGLHVGEHVEQNSYGIVGCSVVSSATLGDALRSLERYLPIWTNAGKFKLDVEPIRRAFSVEIFEWLAARNRAMTSRCRWRRWRDLTVSRKAQRGGRARSGSRTRNPRTFPNTRASSARPCALACRSIRCSSIARCSISQCAAPICVVHEVITAAAEQLLAVDPGNANLTQSVLSFIRQRLCSGDFSLREASRHLGLSRRTLQRKLRQESASHRLLVEQARRDLSRCLLLGSHATATEAAYALGFSDPTAFHHAFQRWHGMPPQAYRDAKIR